MPGYVKKALQCFAIPPMTIPQHAPHACSKPIYVQHQQLTKAANSSPLLNAMENLYPREIFGTLLYYSHIKGSHLIIALNTLMSTQTDGTKATANA